MAEYKLNPGEKIDDGRGFEALTNDLDLHSSIATQVGIIGTEEREIFPENSIESSNTIRFNIYSSLDNVIKPCELSLQGVYKIVTADGKDIPDQIPDPTKAGSTIDNPAKRVLPINFPNGSAFKSLQVALNDQVIEGGTTLQAWRSDLCERLFNNKAVKERQHYLRGWMEEGKAWETLSQTEKDLVFKATKDNNDHPDLTGFKARFIRSKCSREFRAISPIHTSITQQGRILPPNTTLSLTFTKHDLQNFNVLTDQDDHNYKLKLVDLKVIACIKKIDPDVLSNMHELAKKGEDFTIPITRVEMYHFTKSGTGTNVSENNIIKAGNVAPNRMFVTFVDQEAFAGSKKKDPFNYTNIGIRTASLVADGNRIVGREITCNRDEFDFNEPVHYLYKAVNLFPHDEEALGIDVCNYAKRNFILGFKLGYTGASPLELSDVPEKTFYSLDIHLNKAYDKPLAMLVLMEYPSEIKIDVHGNVKKSEDALALN
jgi:hypothetical protein